MDLRAVLANEDRSTIERWAQSRTKSAYLGDHLSLCRVLGDVLTYVDTRDVSVAPHLILNGYWEMWITMAVARQVQPGWRCIDVGANFGYYTLLLAHLVGEKGAVQAWEPQARAVECIRRSLHLNGWVDRVEVLERAAHSAEGDAQMNECEGWDWGSRRAVPWREGAGPQIRCDRPDALDFAQEPVDFVKIDVEGAENHVWEGLAAIRNRSPNLRVLMEYTPRMHPEPEALLRAIQGKGFALRRVDAQGELVAVTEGELLDGRPMEMLWLSRT